MAMTHPNLIEKNPIKLREFRKNNTLQQTYNGGIAFWAFLLSIFVYISIFYIFNLSPLNLLNSTKFWFFMSNTLIIIIAADFGAFFSSQKTDFYQDYLKTSPSFEYYMQRPNFVEKNKAIQEKLIHEVIPHEEVKCAVIPPEIDATRNTHEVVAKNMELVAKDVDIVSNNDDSQKQNCNDFQEGKRSEAKCTRSNSEVVGIIFGDNNKEEEKKNCIQRSQSERYNYDNLKNVEEENEFSEMSVEELNRRVEDFIQRFNRQIRLQAASRKLQNN